MSKPEPLKGKNMFTDNYNDIDTDGYKVFKADDVASAVLYLKKNLSRELSIQASSLEYIYSEIDEAFSDVVDKKEEESG